MICLKGILGMFATQIKKKRQYFNGIYRTQERHSAFSGEICLNVCAIYKFASMDGYILKVLSLSTMYI